MGNLLNNFQENVVCCKKPRKKLSFYKDSIYVYKTQMQKKKMFSYDENKLIVPKEEVISQNIKDFSMDDTIMIEKYSNIQQYHFDPVNVQNLQVSIENILLNTIENDIRFRQEYLLEQSDYTNQLIAYHFQDQQKQTCLVMLQKLLNQENINLMYDDFDIQKEPIHFLRLQNIHVMAHPDSKGYYQLYTRKKDINLKALSNQQKLQNELLIMVEKMPKSLFFDKNISFELQQNSQIVYGKFAQPNEDFLLNICIKRIKEDKNFQVKLLQSLQETFQNKVHVVQQSLNIYFNSDDFNPWKDHTYERSNERIDLIGEHKYIHPPKGWVRYGIKVDQWYSKDLNWLQKNEDSWPAGYIDFHLIFDKKYKIFLEKLARDKDVGSNGNQFNTQMCQTGVVLFKTIPEYEKYGFMDVQLLTHAEKSYRLLLQCRFNPKKFRLPKSFKDSVFLLNDFRDVRPYGILMQTIE